MQDKNNLHRPRKRFGQHFLHDPNILRQIVDAIQPKPTQSIVEIGPGQGALTHLMLERAQQMTAIELDRDLIPLLQESTHAIGTLNLINADALDFDFSSLTSTPQHLRITGNLPYNISTPLIFHLLEYLPLIKDMHFLLQKEVVDRLAAQPGSSAYGRLSVMVQYYCSATRLFRVGPGAFRPPPKVDSAVVRLIPHSPIPFQANHYPGFSALVRQAFSQRRKTLRRSLKSWASEKDFLNAGIDSGLRPEQLSPQQFVELSNVLTVTS